MEEKRKNYCRACGVNKGHNFGGCTNARGLREIIRIQDGQMDTERNWDGEKKELQAEIAKITGDRDLISRVFHVLLSVCEGRLSGK